MNGTGITLAYRNQINIKREKFYSFFDDGKDWIFPALRESYAMIHRGYDLIAYISQIFGNAQDEQDFQDVKDRAESFYENIGQVFCPYFKDEIAFNSKGLRHLKFKSDRQARSRKDQYSRLKLLNFAPEVLKQSYTLQGIWKTKTFEEYKTDSTNSQWTRILKEVVFYEFVAVLNQVRVKIIVKEVLGGKKHFWSVIPFWGIKKENSTRILHSGNPEID